jgi:hypothetical protein
MQSRHSPQVAAKAELIQKPSQSYVAQTTAPGIAIVNGHSKGVQFTPGGLYKVIGSGFGAEVGALDLVGPPPDSVLKGKRMLNRTFQASAPQEHHGETSRHASF